MLSFSEQNDSPSGETTSPDEINDGLTAAEGLCLHDLISQWSKNSPHSIAVTFGGKKISYQELEDRATVLASQLRKLEVGPGSLVPLFIDRSIDMIIGLYGIIKAGGAYVPVDPENPTSRLNYLLTDINGNVVVTQSSLRSKLPEKRNIINIDQLDERSVDNAISNESKSSPSDLAYVIYTSGSTGEPKGVCIEHRNIVSYIRAFRDRLGIDESLSYALVSSVAADLGNTVIFGALTTGGTLQILSKEEATNPRSFAEFFTREKPDVLKIVPSHLAALQGDGDIQSILPQRHLVVGGDVARLSWIKNWFENSNGCQIHNHYGPTETTVGVSTYSLGSSVPETESGSLPIGTALSHAELTVVDENLQPTPNGEPGELLIGGPCVGRGYWNRKDLTKERFIPDPFSSNPNARRYRSGDRCRILEDGSLEFMGRIDEQIKIRGYRVELGEIQAALLRCEGIEDAAVITKTDSSRTNQLIAFAVSANKEKSNEASVRQFLENELPEYMQPKAIVFIESLPLTPNGKIDRQALSEIETIKPVQDLQGTAPETETEKALAGVWGQLLDVGQIKREDEFINLGGHSLIAIRLIAKVGEAFGVDLSVAEIFKHASLQELSRLVESKKPDPHTSKTQAIPRIERTEKLPLSPVQENILLECIRNPDRPTFNEISTIHTSGEVDVEKLGKALNKLVAYHEVFRTTFNWESGELHAQIVPEAQVDFFIEDFRQFPSDEIADRAEVFANNWSQSVFDLKKAPLIRAFFGIHSDDDARLYLVYHHLSGDGVTSNDVILKDLWSLYSAEILGSTSSPLPPVQIAYADYAAWEQTRVQNLQQTKHLEYWLKQLEGFHTFELPTDKPRPQKITHVGQRKVIRFSKELTQSIHDIAAELKTTNFVFLLSAFKALMHRLSQDDDITLGSILGGREHPQTEEMAGCFMKYLILRSEVAESVTFSQFLSEVQTTLYEALEHQDASLLSIQECMNLQRDPSRHPFYQIMFLMEPPKKDLSIPWTSNRLEFYPGATKLDLTVEMDERDGEIFGRFEYNTDLFESETIDRLASQYETLIQGIINRPSSALDDLPVLSPDDEAVVLAQYNDTTHSIDSTLRLHDRLSFYATETPNAIALAFEGRSLTYLELDQMSSNLASHLQRAGALPNELVAVVARRSLNLPTALFGVLKSGAAYLPIDPDQPTERIQYLLEDSDAKLVLVDPDVSLPPEYGGKKLIIEDLTETATEDPLVDPAKPTDLAYVIYTSGSTGKPKGAMIEHRSIVNRLLWMAEEYQFTSDDIQIQKTPTTFDVSVHELFLWSFVGGRLVIPPLGAEKDPAALINEIETHGVTQVHFVPSMLEAFLGYLSAFEVIDSLSSLRNVHCSGEALPLKSVEQFQEMLGTPLNIGLHNLYGPTEAAVDVSYFDCSLLDGQFNVPIGQPVWNTQLYILDKHLRPLPVGIPGELYIGGLQVGRGYLNRPELTADAFLPDPFSENNEAKIYRTGDIARWRPDGNLEYLGRNDFQIKIRGIRIEPGEIESAIRAHSEITGAAVVSKKTRSGDTHLIGYYTSVEQEEGIDKQAILTTLREKLPEHLIPTKLIELKAFPLNPSGKLDRKALPEPDWSTESIEETPIEQITDPIEGVLASIWTQVLNRETLNRDAGFFEQGGHSLLAVKLLGRIRSSLGISLTIPDFLEASTFETLLAKVRSADPANEPSFGPVSRTEESLVPVSWGQMRWWLLQQMDQSGVGFNIAYGVHIRGQLDVDKLEAGIVDTISRHEALRTVFDNNQNKLLQRIHAIDDANFTYITKESAANSTSEELIPRYLSEEWNRKFDLESNPPFFARIISFSESEHLLTLAMHHIIADEACESIIYAGITSFYNSEPPTEENLDLQLGDFAVWERSAETVARVASQSGWWEKRLKDAPAILELPTDFPRADIETFVGDRVSCSLRQPTADAFKKMIRQNDCTHFMGLQAAWAVFLGRLCSSNDVVIGAPVSLRNNPGLENTIGFLLNSLPFRVSISEEQSFIDLLSETRANTLDTYRHSELPFEKILDLVKPERSPGITPIFQVMLVMNGEPTRPPQLNGLETEVVKTIPKSAKFDLTLFVTQIEDRLELKLEYRTDLFEQETVSQWLKDFSAFLDTLSENFESPLASLTCISNTSREEQLAWSKTEDTNHSEEATLCSLFSDAANKAGDQAAVISNDKSLSYSSLNDCVASWSYALRSRATSTDRKIGVCFDRSTGLLVAILAAMRAGAAYVPLDPGWPKSRLSWVIADSGMDTIQVSTGKNAQLIRGVINEDDKLKNINIVEIEADNPTKSMPAERIEDSYPEPEDLAYVIYTSGSTGLPKGVLVNHRNAVASTMARQSTYPFSPKKFLLLSPPIFDSSVAGLFWTLTTGGTLILPPQGSERDPEILSQLIIRDQISHYLCLPSMHKNLLGCLENKTTALETVIVAGESCPIQLPASHRQTLPNVQLFNEYGPTEGTVWCTAKNLTDWNGTNSVPIGKPIPNSRVYLADRKQRLLPRGAKGEIVIAGKGLTQGYLNRPELTQERFLHAQDLQLQEERIYRTGDLARWNKDGDLEFLGRIDAQVKIRGYRIEPGEIESCLESLPSIETAIVFPSEQEISLETKIPEMGSIDLELLLKDLPEEDINEVIQSVDGLSEAQLDEELSKLYKSETNSPGTAEKVVRREDFRLELHTHKKGFIDPPREAQRRWIISQTMEEAADDLVHSDKIAKHFISGSGHTVEAEFRDITQAELSESEIMEDWQVPVMQAMVDFATEDQGDVLEIGFGRGVSSEMIQKKNVRSHTIVEINDYCIEKYFNPWRQKQEDKDIRLVHSLWQDAEPELGLFDGIFFHSFPLNEKEFEEYVLKSVTFAEHAFPVMAKHLKPGGAFTYLTLEIDSLSRRHQRSLFKHFSSITTKILNLDIPDDSHDIWWAQSMVIIKAVK